MDNHSQQKQQQTYLEKYKLAKCMKNSNLRSNHNENSLISNSVKFELFYKFRSLNNDYIEH